ncbi:glycoside hydrolase family 31 protein [Bifidobacterium scardovii]|uniref:Family 31 glucosidase n=1 Tax=Bifidobacterium scardovii TaxID=158787 RepID=A0A087D3E9_9BIFI|nr:glycoside hydrolase family 31 protein [Bifidobacterium scardovii]KFI90049.1 family 31 glucosidase [Bifidobacterium scardovii]MDK6349161.1 glycoside hydrolase family 31 protein [Bifidobacterium scardovii]MDU8980797.1 glycoside hydrolase family 31 protein [Bifidobacterium scardovii]BAQ32496.1 glycosyl hydrolase [Bifidobacterium scardovii JCM 12489 = DSM 13734]
MTTETTTAAADVSVESAGKTLDTSNIAAQVFRVVGGDAAGDASAATAIEWTCDGEYLRVDAWGANSVRVRSRLMQRPLDTDWALLPPAAGAPAPSVTVNATGAVLVNGEITVRLDLFGWQKDQLRLTFENTRTGKVLLREASDGGALRLRARAHHPLESGAESPVASFEPPAGEHLYGMGEYQQNVLDLKGSTLELAHRNSQCSVPFVVSSAGYGFLWHNPSVGRVTFAQNRTEWHADFCDQIDYWITAGDTPARIEAQYADATGHAPVMPEWGLGFWQCKLRYWNQEQLLEVARGFKERNIPIDLIVIDFFHWPLMGDFRFDEEFWPDVKAMTDELHRMGIKLMVSIWPQIDLESENYNEMRRRNFLAKTRTGKDVGMWWPRDSQFFDATNPEARQWLWEKIRKNYTDLGVDAFWLDEAEPEWGGDYDYAHYLFHAGPVGKVGNLYPQKYNQTFYDGQLSIGRENNAVNLSRAAWAGAQRYGALVWSGDVHSTFDDLKAQITCAIHMGAAGIPWFTTDMGGFAGSDITTDAFKELFVRWCQFSTFLPVMRNHGDRGPNNHQVLDQRGNRITHVHTGDNNEPWSFGPEVERTMVKYITLRETMRPYARELFAEAHESGQPLVRGLFYEFPGEEAAADIADEYLFGPDLLVAPVTELGARSREVYLPGGEATTWTNLHDGAVYAGGQTVTVEAPLDVVPAFARNGKDHGLQGLI